MQNGDRRRTSGAAKRGTDVDRVAGTWCLSAEMAFFLRAFCFTDEVLGAKRFRDSPVAIGDEVAVRVASRSEIASQRSALKRQEKGPVRGLPEQSRRAFLPSALPRERGPYVSDRNS
jgi:hypothetical protein